MSTHANQAEKSGPSSSRKEIRGANPTYKSSVQEGRTRSSSKSVGTGSDTKKVVGGGSDPVGMLSTTQAKGQGNGHYTANK